MPTLYMYYNCYKPWSTSHAYIALQSLVHVSVQSIFLPVQTDSARPGPFDLECILPVLNGLLDKGLQKS